MSTFERHFSPMYLVVNMSATPPYVVMEHMRKEYAVQCLAALRKGSSDDYRLLCEDRTPTYTECPI